MATSQPPHKPNNLRMLCFLEAGGQKINDNLRFFVCLYAKASHPWAPRSVLKCVKDFCLPKSCRPASQPLADPPGDSVAASLEGGPGCKKKQFWMSRTVGNPYQTASAAQGFPTGWMLGKGFFYFKKVVFLHPGPPRPFGKGFPQSGSRKNNFLHQKMCY